MTAMPATTRPGVRPHPARPGDDRPPGRPAARARRPQPTPQELAATAERLAAFLGRWYVDAQAGRVEVRQLRRLLTPTAEQRVLASVLRARARQRQGARRPGTVLVVRRVVVATCGDRFETIALVDDGVRTVPVVAVLHPTRRGWLVSELARPDDGLPALAPPVLREDRAPYRQ